jgi:L-lactate dehydrogenase complex protein LldE
MKIALFATCIVDAMFPRAAEAAVTVLERLGHQVIFPRGQACRGQMHVNSGYFKEALPVVANHVRAFEAEDYDVAVAPSGSCVASVKHQHPMIARRAGDQGLEDGRSPSARRPMSSPTCSSTFWASPTPGNSWGPIFRIR